MNTPPTTEDRIWAVISHLSCLALGMGIVLPILAWSDQRRKSNYPAFQSLQALGYQSLGFTIWILSCLIIIIAALTLLLIIIGSRGGSSENPDTVLAPLLTLILIALFCFFAIYFLLPIIAAIACALGKDFRYPIMGDRLARYLRSDPNQDSDAQNWFNEDHEFRWVAAMGHFSILILVWGMLAPMTAWILYGKRSFFLRFQSAQTLVYQAAATVLFGGAAFLYLLGFLALTTLIGLMGEPDLNSPIAMFGFILFGLALLIAVVIVLLVPLLHIVGQWAGYRVLKGDNYRYPWVGRLVDKWISNKSIIEEKPV
jgi:uncharacterized Tic20 family protein